VAIHANRYIYMYRELVVHTCIDREIIDLLSLTAVLSNIGHLHPYKIFIFVVVRYI